MKEQVKKFDLEAAFKALNEIEIPKVDGVKPNKTNHKELVESMRPTPKTDCLLEDYYDVNNGEELEAAQADRAEEVAQAKLAKIEKIVDLDAESPEDIQPSYVGKTIIQCPQCMTLFYRDQADIHVSDDDPTVVNVGEQCPNCNNDSGYNVIGKVAAEEQPAEMPAEAPVEENELDLNFEEPAPEEEQPIEEEKPAEENGEEELNLEPVEEPVEENKEEEKPEEEEKKEESFEPHSENILAEQVENALKEDVDELTKKLKEHDEYIKVLQDEIKAEEEAVKNAKNDFIKKMHENNLASLKDALDKAIPEEVKAEAAIEELPTAEDAAKDMTKNEALKEDILVDIQLKDENDIDPEGIKDEIENLVADHEEISDDSNLTTIVRDVEEIIDPTEEDNKAEEKNEALAEEDEKFPDPEKHELVDTIDGIEVYHCKGCGKFGAKINDKVIKKDSKEEIEACIKGECKEAICPKCGKEVEDPCETDREAYKCGNNLEEDIIAKDAPKENAEVKMEQRPVSEIHKGKKEHVPGAIVEESLTEAADVKAELDAFVANLGEGCEHCEESVENEIKLAEVEQEVDNEPLTEDGEKCDISLMKEINEPMSFKELINDPTFKQFGESIEESNLEEELPATVVAAGEEAANNLEKLKDEDNAYVDQLEKEQEARKFAEENAEFDAEELNDSFINETVSNYLTEVYSNVKDFTATECSMNDNKLVIEGIINFKSGKTKTTKFEFTQVTPVLYEGINKDLAENGKFTLNCFREGSGKILMAESLAYNYKIGDSIVEGLTKKAGR